MSCLLLTQAKLYSYMDLGLKFNYLTFLLLNVQIKDLNFIFIP